MNRSTSKILQFHTKTDTGELMGSKLSRKLKSKQYHVTATAVATAAAAIFGCTNVHIKSVCLAKSTSHSNGTQTNEPDLSRSNGRIKMKIYSARARCQIDCGLQMYVRNAKECVCVRLLFYLW